MASTRTRLAALEASFPKMERSLALEVGMDPKSLGIVFGVEPPTPVTDIPTFDPKRRRPLSPQFQERFKFASNIAVGTETWLGGKAIERTIKQASVRRYHNALRDNWEDSAPARFRDDQLSIFSVGEDPSDSLTYVVWVGDGEPQLWTYSGQSESKHADLNAKLDHELQG
jgi:hypothetical protein